jgi:hypothetical protein
LLRSKQSVLEIELSETIIRFASRNRHCFSNLTSINSGDSSVEGPRGYR